MELLEIPRPIALSFSQRDFRIVHRIAQTLGSQLPTRECPMGEVWLIAPASPLLTPDFESLTTVLTGTLRGKPERHWGLDVLPAMILHSKSLLVVLTKYSSVSESVALEISVYPAGRQLWIMRIDDTSIPEAWLKRHEAKVFGLPSSLNLTDILTEVKEAAQRATASGQLENACKLYWEAINIQGIVNPGDLESMIYCHIRKGRLELKLNLGTGAAQTLAAAMILLDKYRDKISRAPVPENDESDEAGQLAAGKLWYFGTRVDALYLLGLAYTFMCKDGQLTTEELQKHSQMAHACWRDCLLIIDKVYATLGEWPLDSFRVIREMCLKFLGISKG